MKIGSWNVRGLGDEAKKDEVFSFLMKFHLDFCCLQETKMERFTDNDGKRIWRNGTFGWRVEEAEGRSGGILSCWDERWFMCTSSWNIGGAVIVNGRWKATRDDVCIINVMPCVSEGRNGGFGIGLQWWWRKRHGPLCA